MVRVWSSEHEEALLKDDFGLHMPWMVYVPITWIVQFLQWLLNVITPAPLRLAELALGGHVTSHVVLSLTQLGVADALLKGPRTIQQLAKSVGADAERLERAMRAAINAGIFGEVRTLGYPVRYRNNKVSATLCEDHVQSQKYMVLAQLGDGFKTMNSLTYGIKTGGNVFQHYTGRDDSHWGWLRENPEAEDRFSRSMMAVDNLCWAALLADIPWGKWNRYIDIAGAYGRTISAILHANPRAQGVLFDQEQVVKRAEKLWEVEPSRASSRDRISFKTGSFFEPESLPKAESGKDVFYMRLILHDWNDGDCIAILRSIRHAIGNTGASLLIIDSMPTPDTHHIMNRPVFINDIAMMSILGGMERSPSDLERLFAQSGFKTARVHQTRSIMTAVEALPVHYQTPHIPRHVGSGKGSAAREGIQALEHEP